MDAQQTNRINIAHKNELALLYEPHRLQVLDSWEFVVETDVNHAPEISTVSTLRYDKSSGTHTLQLNATDPNGDQIRWDKRSGPTFLTINQSGLLSINTNHSSASSGYHNMTVRARDWRNGSYRGGSDTLDIRVQIIQPNRAPVLQSISSRTITLGQSITINLLATDADDDTITYTKDKNVGSLDSASGVFTWTPTATGTTNIVFTAADGRGGTHNRTASIRVNPRPVIPPSPPVLAAIGNRAVVAGNQVRIVLSATDPDDLPITYSKSGSFGALNGNVFTWTPTTAQTRSITFTATATGGTPANESDSEAINIIVSANRPPVLAEIGNRTVRRGSTLTINLSASDPEGDPITYSKTGVGTLSGSTYTYSPTSGTSLGNKPVTFTASATGGSDSETIQIKVTAPPASPPIFEFVPPDQTREAADAGATKTFYVRFRDPSHHIPTMSIESGPASKRGLASQVQGSEPTQYEQQFDVRLPAAGESVNVVIRISHGGEHTDATITFTVNETDYRPNITITSPADGARITARSLGGGSFGFRISISATITTWDGKTVGASSTDWITYFDRARGTGGPRSFGTRSGATRFLASWGSGFDRDVSFRGDGYHEISYTQTVNNRAYTTTKRVNFTLV